MKNHKRLVLAITGASGSIYAKVILTELLQQGHTVHLCLSKIALRCWKEELGESDFDNFISNLPQEQAQRLIRENSANVGATIASGSFKHDGMIIAPCTMKTLAAVANGISSNLIERAADVCLKERRKLILVPRETPLSMIHLQNMLTVTQAGGIIAPANPGFYHKDMSFKGLVNFVAGKVLDLADIDHALYQRWEGS